MKKFILYITFLIGVIHAQPNQNCAGALPFCSDNTYSFPMNTSAPDAEVGPDYGCLGSQPNPAWYYLQIDQAGPINIYIESTSGMDVDFICWGPFPTVSGNCDNLTAANTVDCSFSASPTENCLIPSAAVGEIYILLLTNFSNMPSDVVFSQTNAGAPGAGSSDCDILNANVGNNGPVCVGETLELYADSVENVTYTWIGPGGFTSNLEDPVRPNATVSMSGTYTCYINGPTFNDTVQTTVVVNVLPGGVITGEPNCINELATFGVSGANDTLTGYQWNFGVIPTATSTLSTPSFAYSLPGNYTVEVVLTTDEGCVDSITKNVTVDAKPKPYFTADVLEGCYPFPVSFDNLSTIDFGTISTYTWDFGFGSASNQFEPTITYPNATQLYNVSLTASTASGCDSTFTRAAYISVHAQPKASFTYNPTYPDEINSDVIFDNLSLLGESYIWNLGDGTILNTYAPSHVYPHVPDTYYVSLIATTGYGCADTTGAILIVKPTYTIYIPNTFTPSNNDGKNDVFRIKGFNILEAKLEIYNRDGLLIFEQSGQDPMLIGWDGMLNGKTEIVQQGIYAYKVTFVDILKKEHVIYGNINVIR